MIQSSIPVPPILGKTLAALAASLLLAGGASAQTITNPSFEADTFTVDPGYVSANSPITGWTGADPAKYGINPAATSPIANNGAIPNGTKVAFILASGSMSTDITGLTPDTTYKVSFRTNATTGQTPILRVSTNGTGVALDVRTQPVALTNPYKFVDYEFKATAATHTLTLANVATGTNTILVDDFSIGVSGGKWSFRRVTNDADSGIDSQFLYTHAYSFGGSAVPYQIDVNGVRFSLVPGGNPNLPGRFVMAAMPNAFGEVFAGQRAVTGQSNLLFRTFVYGGPASSITLSNLKPNTPYVATIYAIAFDIRPFGRASTFSSSLDAGNRLTIDVDQYDQKNAIAVDYAYTTDATGSAVITYTASSDGSFHTSAFTNRETTPSVPNAPVWTQTPWTNDATSGADGTYLYTHAYSFGAVASSTNLNGVAFTGVANGNPTVAGKFTTTNLASIFNNDGNSLNTPGSRPLANDFIYNGFPSSINLTGLTAGKEYVFTLYTVGWEAAGARKARFQCVLPGLDLPMSEFDQDAYGDNNGVRVECRYTAPASGAASFSAFPIQNASIHTYGFSNRESAPLVNTAPVITLHPAGGSVENGGSFTFRTGVTGSPALSYVWQRNDTDIPNSNTPNLTLTGVSNANAGTYKFIVSNGVNSATSNPAVLTVLDGVPGLFDTGVGADKFALAAGQLDPHYILLVNPDGAALIPPLVESNIPGAWFGNSVSSKWIGPRTDTVAAAGEASNAGAGPGVYVYRTTFDLTGFDRSTVVITGGWACDNLGTAIKVNDGHPDVANPVTGLTNTVQFGSLTTFTINSTNATFVDGVNTVDFHVQNQTVTPGFTGLRLSGLKGLGVILPNTKPKIAVGPYSATLAHNAGIALGVSASGSAPLSYKWFKDDVEIPGQTSALLSILASNPAVAGSYKVSVINSVDTATSAPAVITIPNAAPVATADGLATSKNTAVSVSGAALAANDTDADLDTLTVTAVGAASAQGGTVALASGTVTYTPAAAFTGTDTFTYTVSDGIWGGSASGTVTVSVVEGAVPGLLEIVASRSGATQKLRFRGVSGTAYHLMRSTELTAWTEIALETAPVTGIIEFQDAAAPNERAFYRIAW